MRECRINEIIQINLDVEIKLKVSFSRNRDLEIESTRRNCENDSFLYNLRRKLPWIICLAKLSAF